MSPPPQGLGLEARARAPRIRASSGAILLPGLLRSGCSERSREETVQRIQLDRRPRGRKHGGGARPRRASPQPSVRGIPQLTPSGQLKALRKRLEDSGKLPRGTDSPGSRGSLSLDGRRGGNRSLSTLRNVCRGVHPGQLDNPRGGPWQGPLRYVVTASGRSRARRAPLPTRTPTGF